MRSAQRPKLALVVRGGRGQAAGVQDRGRGGSEKGGKGVQGFIEETGFNFYLHVKSGISSKGRTKVKQYKCSELGPAKQNIPRQYKEWHLRII